MAGTDQFPGASQNKNFRRRLRISCKYIGGVPTFLLEMSGKGKVVMSTIPQDDVSIKDLTTTGGSEKPFSAFELLNNQEILRQGVKYLNKLGTHQLIPVKTNNELDIQKEDNKSDTIDDSVLMPPPKPKPKPKSHFPDEVGCLDAKRKKHKKHKRSSRKEAEGSSSVKKRKRESIDMGSTEGVLFPNFVVHEMEGAMFLDPNFSALPNTLTAQIPAGLKLFLELIGHSTNEQEPNQSTNVDNDEEQTTSECGILKNVVIAYEQKRRQYTKNARIVHNLTNQELLHFYLSIREELNAIFNGIRTSARHALYAVGWDSSKLAFDTLIKEKQLKRLKLPVPFSGEHSFLLVDSLSGYLIDREASWQFEKYIDYVMIPEAFIRIYARMTGQTNKNAELEMMFGAFYEKYQGH